MKEIEEKKTFTNKWGLLEALLVFTFLYKANIFRYRQFINKMHRQNARKCKALKHKPGEVMGTFQRPTRIGV